ncbi:alpha/beta fold hydrolase [Streptomyces sp. NPDC001073]
MQRRGSTGLPPENLGLLLERHPAGMRAVAVSVLGAGPDVICGVRWIEELHRLIPGAELVILENSGHSGHLEEPEVFVKAVTAFVGTPAVPRRAPRRQPGHLVEAPPDGPAWCGRVRPEVLAATPPAAP